MGGRVLVLPKERNSTFGLKAQRFRWDGMGWERLGGLRGLSYASAASPCPCPTLPPLKPASFPPRPPACSDLIDLINGPLSKNDRKKLITLCTVDVHARDVVARLIEERVEAGQCFQWHSQLRYAQNDKTKECQVCGSGAVGGRAGRGKEQRGPACWEGRGSGAGTAHRPPWPHPLCRCCPTTPSPTYPHHTPYCLQVNICDAEIKYQNEYIGNVGCLCITPLTDRCYITLTQAQRLVLGAWWQRQLAGLNVAGWAGGLAG